MLPRMSEARLWVLLRNQSAVRRPGHTWGIAPTQGAELTANGLLGGEGQYAGNASWKRWTKFGHLVL